MPGGFAHLGEVDGELVKVCTGALPCSMHGSDLLRGLAHAPVDQDDIGIIFLRESLPEEIDDFPGAVTVYRTDDLLFLLFRECFAVIWQLREGGELREDGADHHRNCVGVRAESVKQRIALKPVIRHRAGAGVSALFRNGLTDGVVGRGKLHVRDRLQFLYSSTGDSAFLSEIIFRAGFTGICSFTDNSELFQHGGHDHSAVALRLRHQIFVCDAAHDERLVEESVCLRNLHQVENLHAAARLSEQRHVVRVAAKTGDVVMDPPERCHHIGVSRICGVCILFAKRREVEVAEDVQPVIDRDDDGFSGRGKAVSVIGDLFDGGAREVTAAVNPDDDRLLRALIERIGPDVEVLAVFIHGPVAVRNEKLGGWCVLLQKRADKPIGCRVFHTFPVGRHRLVEAFCLGIWDAAECIDPIVVKTLEFSGCCLENRCVFISKFFHYLYTSLSD